MGDLFLKCWDCSKMSNYQKMKIDEPEKKKVHSHSALSCQTRTKRRNLSVIFSISESMGLSPQWLYTPKGSTGTLSYKYEEHFDHTHLKLELLFIMCDETPVPGHAQKGLYHWAASSACLSSSLVCCEDNSPKTEVGVRGKQLKSKKLTHFTSSLEVVLVRMAENVTRNEIVGMPTFGDPLCCKGPWL